MGASSSWGQAHLFCPRTADIKSAGLLVYRMRCLHKCDCEGGFDSVADCLPSPAAMQGP